MVRGRGGRRERDGRPELGLVGGYPALETERGKPNTTGTDEEIGQKGQKGQNLKWTVGYQKFFKIYKSFRD